MDYHENILQKMETYDYELHIEYYGLQNPQYEHFHNQQQQNHEPQLEELQKEYLENYVNQDEEKYMSYIVQADDSLFGLELKFNIRYFSLNKLSADQLMNLNHISENSFYQGLSIKIPKTQKIEQKSSNSIQDCDTHDNFMEEIQKIQTQYFDIYYITSAGQIKGKLGVLEEMLLFDPDLNNIDNINIQKQTHFKNVQNLQFQILFKNITGIHQRSLPPYITDISIDIIQCHIIEIHLQIRRQKVVLIKLVNSELLPQLMKALNSVFISYFPFTPGIIVENNQKKSLESILPFYFFKDDDLEQSIQQTIKGIHDIIIELISTEMFFPELDSDSDIVNNEMFMRVACYFPTIFKSQKWQLLYSSIQHGSSILTLIRNTSNSEPAILFVKDLDKFVFGAYLSEGIHKSRSQFYGTGESFLFTFKNSNKVTVYKWVNKNQYITLCDNDGLAIGCGDKYGLYIDSEIYHGYSHNCETFDNQVLSYKQNFTINQLEIWGLID